MGPGPNMSIENQNNSQQDILQNLAHRTEYLNERLGGVDQMQKQIHEIQNNIAAFSMHQQLNVETHNYFNSIKRESDMSTDSIFGRETTAQQADRLANEAQQEVDRKGRKISHEGLPKYAEFPTTEGYLKFCERWILLQMPLLNDGSRAVLIKDLEYRCINKRAVFVKL